MSQTTVVIKEPQPGITEIQMMKLLKENQKGIKRTHGRCELLVLSRSLRLDANKQMGGQTERMIGLCYTKVFLIFILYFDVD